MELTNDAVGAHAVAELRGVHSATGRPKPCEASTSRSMRVSWWRCWASTGQARPRQSASCLVSAARTPGRPGCSAGTRPCPRPAGRSGPRPRRSGSPTTSPSGRWSTWSESTTPHYLEEAQALASRVVVITRGRIIAQGSVDDLTGRAGLSRVRLRAPSLPDLPMVTRVEASNGFYTLYTADPDGLVRALSLQGVPFTQLQIERASLEEAFLSLTGGER